MYCKMVDPFVIITTSESDGNATLSDVLPPETVCIQLKRGGGVFLLNWTDAGSCNGLSEMNHYVVHHSSSDLPKRTSYTHVCIEIPKESSNSETYYFEVRTVASKGMTSVFSNCINVTIGSIFNETSLCNTERYRCANQSLPTTTRTALHTLSPTTASYVYTEPPDESCANMSRIRSEGTNATPGKLHSINPSRSINEILSAKKYPDPTNSLTIVVPVILLGTAVLILLLLIFFIIFLARNSRLEYVQHH